jgi:hypothetical protein
MANPFVLNERALEIRWSPRGSCGEPGCNDPECVCALCAEPIGKTEHELANADHDIECYGCELCEQQVPIILFRGEGKDCEQAQFHDDCFRRLLGYENRSAQSR